MNCLWILDSSAAFSEENNSKSKFSFSCGGGISIGIGMIVLFSSSSYYVSRICRYGS